MVDYIIVGTGLAGISFIEKLITEGKSVHVIDGEGRSSSLIAGGMFNPVVLKRFTDVWKVGEQLALAIPFYEKLEEKLGISILFKRPLYRRLASIEEQNDWFVAADKPNLSPYLSGKLVGEQLDGIKAPYGYGEVLHCGYLETSELIFAYRAYLRNSHTYWSEEFDYSLLTFSENSVSYKGVEAKHIVFAEGFGMLQNPYFNTLPLDGTKGELLYVRIPGLDLGSMIKSSIFLIPIGNDLYKVGATYDWEDKTDEATFAARETLLKGLEDLITCPYEVVLHKAGVRPTVKDRRPLLGRSLVSDRIHVLNGLGTRGVLLGPFLAEKLYNTIEKGEPLEEAISIHRYKKFKIKK